MLKKEIAFALLQIISLFGCGVHTEYEILKECVCVWGWERWEGEDTFNIIFIYTVYLIFAIMCQKINLIISPSPLPNEGY